MKKGGREDPNDENLKEKYEGVEFECYENSPISALQLDEYFIREELS